MNTSEKATGIILNRDFAVASKATAKCVRG